jgi:hypothetical protein
MVYIFKKFTFYLQITTKYVLYIIYLDVTDTLLISNPTRSAVLGKSSGITPIWVVELPLWRQKLIYII